MIFNRKKDKILENNPSNMMCMLLTILKVKHSKKTIQELKNNPYFPSLVSISQTLSKLNIENVSVKATYDELISFPTPLVVHAYEGLFLIVKEVKENEIIFFKEAEKIASRTKENFIQSWGGYTLLVNATNTSVEKHYNLNIFKERIQKTRLPVLATVIIVLVYFFLNQNFSLNNFLFKSFSILGIIVSIFLIIQLVDKNNIFIKKICHNKRHKKINCSSILNSKSADFFGLISWSELGFIYFLSQLILFTLLGKTAFHFLAILSLFSFFYIFYSIYYQWKIAKIWCKLCLFIQMIFLSQGMLSLVFLNKFNPFLFEYQVSDLILLILVPAFILVLTSYIIPIISELNHNKKALKLSTSIKMEKSIFQKKLNQSFKVDKSGISDILLVYGNDEPINTLFLVINPTCAPCIKTHQKIANIICYNTNIQIQEIFLVDNVNSNSYRLALRMIEIYLAETKDYFKEAILDYYHNHSTNPEKWLYRHKNTKYNTGKAIKILAAQTKWLFSNSITSTPHIICDNKFLPEQYTIEDLEYILY